MKDSYIIEIRKGVYVENFKYSYTSRVFTVDWIHDIKKAKVFSKLETGLILGEISMARKEKWKRKPVVDSNNEEKNAKQSNVKQSIDFSWNKTIEEMKNI